MIKKPWVPYVLPFVVFILLTETARYFTAEVHFLYVAKIIMVGLLLWLWRHAYASDFSFKLTREGYLIAIVAGLAVLALWILPDSFLPQYGADDVFNPFSFNISKNAVYAIIAIRLIGAAVVVPVMEELFWRSFLLRYLINPDFNKVALGTFSWFSFIAVVVLFGIEHHRMVQGMIAGVIYTALLIRQKSLIGCTIAHAVTNLVLGFYVIITQSWEFW